MINGSRKNEDRPNHFNTAKHMRFTACGLIFPFLTGLFRRIHAAIVSFGAGVMPPMHNRAVRCYTSRAIE